MAVYVQPRCFCGHVLDVHRFAGLDVTGVPVGHRCWRCPCERFVHDTKKESR